MFKSRVVMPWYSHMRSSHVLTKQERAFLDKFTEEFLVEYLLEHHLDEVVNIPLMTVKSIFDIPNLKGFTPGN